MMDRKSRRLLVLLLAMLICITFSAIAYADAPADAQGETLTAAQINLIDPQTTWNNTVYLPLNGTTTLQVNAGSTDGEVSYQWCKNSYSEEYGYYYPERIEGATSSSYTTDPIVKYTDYYCEVSDTSGSIMNVWFPVSVENHLSAEAVGGDRVSVAPNSTATLAVAASCDTGALSYQWYRWLYDGETGYSREKIENSMANSCVTAPITERIQYDCEVSDQYGNNITQTFSVGIENHLTATPNSVTNFSVSPNSTATMSVTASFDVGPVSYQWYKVTRDNEYREEPIENATAASYTTEPVTRYTEYYCDVSDTYGNHTNVWFWVGIENNLTAIPNGSTNVSVSPNSTATLSVTASCSDGSLSYQWWERVYILTS